MSLQNPRQATDAPIEVLHVDDDESVLDLTKSYLETQMEQFNITTVSDPTEVLTTLREQTVHCLISDMTCRHTMG